MASQKFHEVKVRLRSGEHTAKFEYTSQLGFSGCEGFVRPGILEISGKKRLVQTKFFYKETYDDRGEPFSQDPDKKVRESYDSFRKLEELGFRVIPFYGMMQTKEGLLLLMDDLRKGETVEVYDEKWLHRERKVENVINGQKIKTDPNEMFDNLANKEDIMLGFMRTHLLMRAHNISLGYPGGTSHMITRDPATNQGDIFVTDIGQYWKPNKCKYEKTLNMRNLLKIPEEEIEGVYGSLLQRIHPSQDVGGLYQTFKKQCRRKKEFMDLAYMATIGVSVREFVGGWYKDAEWAKKVFPKNDFPNEMMQAKLAFMRMLQSFREYTGEELYDSGTKAHSRFMQGKKLEDLLVGIDFSQLAILDARMRYIAEARVALDNEERISDKPRKVSLDKNGFPNMEFFERYDESLNDRHVIEIRGGCYLTQDEYVLSVELDWETAMSIESTLGYRRELIRPEQIKGVKKNGEVITDFDYRKVRVEIPDMLSDKSAYYIYGDEVIYFAQIGEGADTSFITNYKRKALNS